MTGISYIGVLPYTSGKTALWRIESGYCRYVRGWQCGIIGLHGADWIVNVGVYQRQPLSDPAAARSILHELHRRVIDVHPTTLVDHGPAPIFLSKVGFP